MQVSITVNGAAQEHDVEPRTLLVQYLREACGLTGTKVGCDTSSCGACTVLVDGESVKSCTMLAAQADGARGHHDRGPRRRRRAAPGAAGVPRAPRAAVRLLHRGHGDGGGLACSRRTPHPTEREVRLGLEGNLCRCTGYHNIVAVGARRGRARCRARQVIPAAFDYVRADSVDEAIALLAEHGDDAKLLAGGMSLLPLMKLRLATPTVLVDVGRLARPLVRARRRRPPRDRRAHPPPRPRDRATCSRASAACCARSPREVGDNQVRHRGTIGGSVAHGDPASDLPAALLALDADVRGAGPGGERDDRRRPTSSRASSRPRSRPTSCSPRSGCRRPAPNGFAYQKFNRRAQDWAIVGAVAVHAERRDACRARQHGLHAAARDRGRGRARAAARRRPTPRAAPAEGTEPPPTSTRRPSTASTSPACSCAARARSRSA